MSVSEPSAETVWLNTMNANSIIIATGASCGYRDRELQPADPFAESRSDRSFLSICPFGSDRFAKDPFVESGRDRKFIQLVGNAGSKAADHRSGQVRTFIAEHSMTLPTVEQLGGNEPVKIIGKVFLKIIAGHICLRHGRVKDAGLEPGQAALRARPTGGKPRART